VAATSPRSGALAVGVVLSLAPACPVVASSIDVPLADPERWTAVEFRGIPPNAVEIADDALHIAVRRSAGPLVQRMDTPINVTGITVEARWTGELRLPPGVKQGEAGADDFVLRLGLIEAGARRLNWWERHTAKPWVRALFELAPPGAGVNGIRFVSTTQQPDMIGSRRAHPLSEMLEERRVRHLDGPSAFTLSARFDKPIETLGLWVAADGDDTGSSFDLYIERVTLHTD
jgi:hypothetical protein